MVKLTVPSVPTCDQEQEKQSSNQSSPSRINTEKAEQNRVKQKKQNRDRQNKPCKGRKETQQLRECRKEEKVNRAAEIKLRANWTDRRTRQQPPERERDRIQQTRTKIQKKKRELNEGLKKKRMTGMKRNEEEKEGLEIGGTELKTVENARARSSTPFFV